MVSITQCLQHLILQLNVLIVVKSDILFVIVPKKTDSAGTSTNSELVVSALSSAEIAGDAETAVRLL